MWAPEERINILRAETERLEQFLQALPAEAWERPSACERWTVADVVAHLTGLSRSYPPRIMRALQGDASPDAPARRRLGTGQIDPTVEGDQALRLRQELGDQLLAAFLKSNHALDHALAQAGPQDWDKRVYRAVGTESLRNLIDVFITERTIHGWDIRSQFEPQARLSPACVPIIVARIPQRPRWWSFSTAAGFSPFPLRYRFAMTHPAPSVVDVVVTEEQQYLEVASKEEAHVTIRCGGETFILLMYGRIQPEAALAEGRMSCEGDPQLVTAFAKRFTGG